MSRIAKIARLPWETREELNYKLRNGASGPGLVKWLNELPEVKEVLAAEFGGVPVSEQNLSAWRQGEYQDWLARLDGRELADDLVAEANALAESQEAGKLTEGLSAVLATKFAWVLANWEQLGEAGRERELKPLRAMSREVARLRKGDQNVVRLELQKDRDASWMEAYTTKQWTKKYSEWARKSYIISAYLRREWPDEEEAIRYLWDALGFSPEQIREMMAEPDKVPVWEKWRDRDKLASMEGWCGEGI